MSAAFLGLNKLRERLRKRPLSSFCALSMAKKKLQISL
jgi:hypothetical protein